MNFDNIKKAVDSIEMSNSMKYRIINSCNRMGKGKNNKPSLRRKLLIACTFVMILSISIGIPIINKNGGFHTVNFEITAYAMDSYDQLNKKISTEEAVFDLSVEDRIGLISSVSGDGDNLVFTDIILKITGENIDSITYSINKGKFVEDVTLTSEENANKKWLLSEKIYIIYGKAGSDIYQGIKEIGDTYTVKYSNQDEHAYTLAIPHDGNYVIDDDIIINIDVKYNDGNKEEQDVIITQESNNIVLRLK